MKNIIIYCLLFSFSVFADNEQKMDKFFYALSMVEASGNPKAFNKKENAIGLYQIRFAYFLDSKVKGNHEDCFDPVFARKVCEAYFRRYAKTEFENCDFEALARLHNSGPNWRKKKEKTDIYWQKVQKHLDAPN